MLVSFELKMTNIGSWDGKWSGEDKRYIVVKNLKRDQVEIILGIKDSDSDSFHYSWDDGWGCNIEVHRIDYNIKRKLSKYFKNGFSGYDWMIENLIHHGSPYGVNYLRGKVNLSKCKEGDVLISALGERLKYIRPSEPHEYADHVIEYSNGAYGTRTNDGYVSAVPESRLKNDQDIIKIL